MAATKELFHSLNDMIPFGGSWGVSQKKGEMPIIDVNLPEIRGLPLEIPCDDCGGSMRLTSKVNQFPFPRSGVVVRLNNEQTYLCGECHSEDSPDLEPESNLQGLVLGHTLAFVTRQLDLKGIGTRSPSVRTIRVALQS